MKDSNRATAAAARRTVASLWLLLAVADARTSRRQISRRSWSMILSGCVRSCVPAAITQHVLTENIAGW